MNSKRWSLAAVACGTFMATLDSSIVNIALPTLTAEFGVSLQQVKWVVMIYLIALTCTLLPFGKLSDIVGRKRIFFWGFVVFTLGSLFSSIARDLGTLVFARGFQAFGGGMMMSNGPAIVTSTFPYRERGAALGILGMVVSAGLISGPSIGGLLVTHWGWRGIFLVNIPIGLIGLVLVRKYIQESSEPTEEVYFDWAGTILQTVVFMLLMLALDPPAISISGSLPVPISRWLLIAVAMLIFLVFLRNEKASESPLIDFSLFKHRTFAMANLAGFLTFTAFSSVTVLMPFFLQEMMKMSPQMAGAFMTAIPLTVLVVSPVSGRLSDKFGTSWFPIVGGLIGSVSLLAMSGAFGMGIQPGMTRAGLAIALMTVGFATGLFQSPNNVAIMSSVPPERLSAAAALIATIRNLGLMTGTGLAMSLFAWRYRVTNDFVASLHTTHFFAAVLAVGALVASIARRGSDEYKDDAHGP